MLIEIYNGIYINYRELTVDRLNYTLITLLFLVIILTNSNSFFRKQFKCLANKKFSLLTLFFYGKKSYPHWQMRLTNPPRQ